ncbi:carbohydrate-binding protein [Microbulbifer thermotolerans]|uniref:carbohydrate-binding protein n=1 Tax=Microbulbifer thermotolerans TaxID=252514 RepID=UPI00224B1457|nr:carbohydrate-binding protein [Microbulbifer thermotolerans]MCX2784533.1 carbohydrate-binding protein [Microbulbifer thermotolerans]
MRLSKSQGILPLAHAVLAAAIAYSTAATAADYRLEAEDFTSVGGTYNDGQPQKISVYTVNGITAINYVNKGDYAEYTLSVPQAGQYDLTYFAGTAIDGARIDFQVNNNGSWQTLARTDVPNAGWDNFQPLPAGSIHLSSGSQQIRLFGGGDHDWQWNLDKMEFAYIDDSSSSSGGGSNSSSSSGGSSSSSGSGSSSSGGSPEEGGHVSGTFKLEAESAHHVGGEIDTYAINGGVAVNYFNSGDYLEYNLHLDQSGLYRPKYYVSTAHSSGVAVGLMATDHEGALVTKNTSEVQSQGGWDSFYLLNAASDINLFSGDLTIRIYGAGTQDFQFNIDYVIFERISDVDLDLDGDSDGIADVNDSCPGTDPSETANSEGCAPSQLDTDKDGIADNRDQCPTTAPGDFVDSEGCASTGADDDDLDGIANQEDQCPDTPFGENVDPSGCTGFEDSDSDGIANGTDQCPSTPAKEFANESGCSPSQVANPHSVKVTVNANIKHSVKGISDFGRNRHITAHTTIYEKDWEGHADKLNYLVNTLDVTLGRDNGTATWKFQDTKEDPNRENWPDLDYMVTRGKELRENYEANPFYKRFSADRTELIAGTNPHPTYPTLSWNANGSTWHGWQPMHIETSAAWMGQYLKHYYANSSNGYIGDPMPKFWEVINEPDMEMKTGKFMVTNQEAIWEYHNLVAQEIRSKLGNEAPLIGGMTWGQHDFYRRDGISRYADNAYDQWIVADDPAEEAAAEEFFRQAMATTVDDTRDQNWYQWDVMWKGFMDAAGHNMDFYSVHVYDWPGVNSDAKSTLRRNGHLPAMLDMIEWYDVYQNGQANRKPIVISEYGAVQGGWNTLAHQPRFESEVLKSFNAMLMQILERPDYVIKSMPFTPAKPLWGYYPGGCGYEEVRNCTAPYHYSLLIEPVLNSDNWQWSDYIKFYELWADIDGTRVDSVSSDPDVQVQSYVNNNELFIIINNLETVDTTIDLTVAGLNNAQLQNVELRNMHFDNNFDTQLERHHMKQMPTKVTLAADATLVLRYTLNSTIAINQSVDEKKYFGNSVSGGSVPHRISVAGGAKNLQVNNVSVPSGYAESQLRLTVALYPSQDDTPDSLLQIDTLTINGHTIETPIDWRGRKENSVERYFNTLEIPVPVDVLQKNNTISVDFRHNGELTVANLVIKEYTTTPVRH